MKGSNPYLFSS